MDIKDTLPKSGHVHEVCKEWLVREDGALAYRLQSQEINEFYKGNKFRNAVVRQDFPTALHEQIKEKETAEQEAARYQKLLKEQEEADKCLAEEIANKLERDEKLKHLKQLEENEMIARQIQETYVNVSANNDGVFRPSISTSTSDSLCLPKNIVVPENGFDSSDFSDNLICDRFEKLHCRPITDVIEQQHEDYENFDVTHNIRNADIIQQKHSHHQYYNQNHKSPQKDFDIIENCSSPDKLLLMSNVKNPNNGIITSTIDHVKYNDKNTEFQICPEVPPPMRKHAKLINANINHANIKNTRDYAVDHHNSSLQMHLNIPEEFGDINDHGTTSKDFVELNKKLEQEKSDEELARYLQSEEQRRNLTQEEKDRLLAIEAQDKELAIMLQEREKAKAKRAREKARLKKLQAKEQAENSRSPIVNEPYSNPKDLITDAEQTKYENSRKSPYNISPTTTSGNFETNNEDIYTLPVDNTNHREIDSKSFEEMTSSISSAKSALSSPSSLGANYHQTTGTESCPKPPYMPIHDIGNNSSLESRKKKSKDKCTHQ